MAHEASVGITSVADKLNYENQQNTLLVFAYQDYSVI